MSVAKTMKINILEGFHAVMLPGAFGLQEIVEQILRGAVKMSSKGNTTTFEDQWSGASVDFVKKGGRLDEISVSAMIMSGNGTKEREVSTIEFTGGQAPRFNKVVKDAEDYYKTSGGTDPFGQFLDFRVKMTNKDKFDGSSNSGNGDAGISFQGKGGPDMFTLNNGGSWMVATGGDDMYRFGKGWDTLDYSRDPSLSVNPGDKGLQIKSGPGKYFRIDNKADGSTDKVKNLDQLIGTNGNDDFRKAVSKTGLAYQGLDGKDKMNGGNGNDNLDGGADNDQLNAKGGKDVVIGGDGKDNAKGGGGRDIVTGDLTSGTDNMKDNLWGNGGVDLFILNPVTTSGDNAYDVVRDFKTNQDFIGLQPPSGFGFGGGVNFNDIDLVKNGKHTMLETNGQAFAELRNVNPNQIDRGHFVEDFEGFALAGINVNFTF